MVCRCCGRRGDGRREAGGNVSRDYNVFSVTKSIKLRLRGERSHQVAEAPAYIDWGVLPRNMLVKQAAAIAVAIMITLQAVTHAIQTEPLHRLLAGDFY